MAIAIKEYRNGVHIGTIRRDIQIIVINCPNNHPPVLSGPYYKEVCAGSTVSFTINTNDYDPNDSLTISWNNSLPGASWTDNNYIAKHPTGSLSWTPGENQSSSIPYTFTVTVKDDACPVNGSTTRAYQILVKPLPRARIIEIDSGCGDYWFYAQHIEGTGPTYMWQCLDPVEYFYAAGPTAHHKFRNPGEYPYSLTMTAKQCSRTYFDTVVVDTFINAFLPNDSDVCFGTYMNITSAYINNTGAVSFQWNTSAADTFIDKALTIIQDTTLIITSSDTMGCKATDSMHINMHNLPVVDVGNDIRICNYSIANANAQVVFDESIMDSVMWLNAATGQQLSFSTSINLPDSGIYICKITDTIGCVGYDTLEVVVSPDITAFAPGTTICFGDDAILNAMTTGGGTASYDWYYNNVLSGSAQQITVSPPMTVDYDLIVYETIDSVTCSDTSITRVRVNPLPIITITQIPQRCLDGKTLQLNNYVTPLGGLWSSDVTSGFVLPDNFIPIAVGTGQHWVYYEYTDPLTTCVNKDSTIISINPLPTPTAGLDDSICSTSGLYDLYTKGLPNTPPGNWRGLAVGGSSYTWYFDPADPSLVDGGAYNLIYNYTDIKGCTNEDTVVLTVFETPVVNPGTYNDVCIDVSFVKLVGVPAGGVWTGAGVTGDYFYPATAGEGTHELTYTVTNVICITENKTSITVNPLPVVLVNTMSGEKTFCRTKGMVELDGKPSGSGGVWTGDGIQGNYFNTYIGADVERSYTMNYEYTDQNGCKSDKDLTLIIRPEPEVEIDTSNDVLCFGNPYEISAAYKNANGIQWYIISSKADGNFNGSVTDTVVGYSPGSADQARLSFWMNIRTTHNDNICPAALDSLEVFMSDMPVPEFTADPMEGCTPLIVDFTDNSTIGLGNLSQFKWSFGDGAEGNVQNPTHTYNKSGTYNVTLTAISDAGCEKTITKLEYITAHVVPEPMFIPNPVLTLVSVPTIGFENQTRYETDGIRYTWNFDDYLVDGGGSSTDKHTSYKYSDTGHYDVQLHAINEFGCQDSFTRMVIVKPDVIMYIPNVFSPDMVGPENNNVFRAVTDGIMEFKIQIFSRWGELLYESNDYESHGWNGTYLKSDEKCQVGAYIYVVRTKAMDGLDYKYSGTVTLLR
jgi:PKD repeat protein